MCGRINILFERQIDNNSSFSKKHKLEQDWRNVYFKNVFIWFIQINILSMSSRICNAVA